MGATYMPKARHLRDTPRRGECSKEARNGTQHHAYASRDANNKVEERHCSVQQGWWTAVERAKEQEHLLLQFAYQSSARNQPQRRNQQ
jgi:hypothetical protein